MPKADPSSSADEYTLTAPTGERIVIPKELFLGVRKALTEKLNGTIAIMTKDGGIRGVKLEAQWNFK